MKVSDLTQGERFLIARRRHGWSQREHAAFLGVTLYRYRAWEGDAEKAPSMPLGRLQPHEECFVRRRRAGIPLQAMADRLGVSRFWLAQMESGRAPVGALEAWWRKKLARAS